MGVGFVALHGIMDSCSFALATSLALSLFLSLCASWWRGRWAGRPDGWTAWFEAAQCGGSDMFYERIGLFLFFGPFGGGENKRG